jgi:hypothetical protein
VDKKFRKYLQTTGAKNLALILVFGLFGGRHERSFRRSTLKPSQ